MQQLARGCIKGFRETHWAAERALCTTDSTEAKPEGVRRGEESVAPGEGSETRWGEGEQKVCVKRSKGGGKKTTLKHILKTGNSRKKQATYLNIDNEKLKKILLSVPQSHRCLEMKVELPVFNRL